MKLQQAKCVLSIFEVKISYYTIRVSSVVVWEDVLSRQSTPLRHHAPWADLTPLRQHAP